MQNIGKIVQIIGAVVDIRFPKESLPKLLNAIEINNNDKKLVVEVDQHTFAYRAVQRQIFGNVFVDKRYVWK